METDDIVHSIQIEVNALRILCEELKTRTDKLENTVITGYNGNLPLAEVVRNLTNTVSDYIARKDKEEAEAKEAKKVLEKEKREQLNRWIILLATIFLPLVATFIGQAVYFYFKLVPLINTIAP